MRRHIAIISVALAILQSGELLAGTPEMAGRFVDLMNYELQFQEYKKQCLAAMQSTPVETVMGLAATSDAAVRPGTKYWPKVIAAYQTYYDEMCSRPSKNEFLGALASAYATNLSDDDLASVIEFHSTEVGKRLISSHQAAAKAVYLEWTRVNFANAPEALGKFYRQLDAIYDETRVDRCRSTASSRETTAGRNDCASAGPTAHLGKKQESP